MKSRIITVLASIAVFVPVVVAAQAASLGDLSATIRAELLSDPRTATLSQAQMDTMVQLLTQEAQKQGITADNIEWRPQRPVNDGAFAAAITSCTSLSCIADYAYGFVGPDAFIAFLLGLSSMGLIWVIAEMLHRHNYPHVPSPPAASGQ